MALLRTEPTRPVSSLPALRELDRSLSGQRADLYRTLARRMAEFGNEPARQAFARVGEMLPHDPESNAGGANEAPPVFQDEELGASRLVTPYAAFSLAVRNQERAFAFWTYVSANSPDPEVQAEAERLAGTEMERVRSLRAARREAYHADRPPAYSRAALGAESMQDLEHRAGETEAALAHLHEAIASALARIGDARAPTIAKAATEARELADRLGALAAAEPGPLPDDAEALVALATEWLEAAVELYLAAAEAARGEDVVAKAQELADHAIRRLSRLR